MSLRFDCQFQYGDGFSLAAAFTAGAGVTALIGPSGGGKTTTLKLIAGLLRPTRGRIVLNDRVLVDRQARIYLPPEQRRVSVVFQDQLLFPHLSVADNLKYGSRRHPGRAVNLARVVELLELGELLSRMPHTLSGGQRQRVALGRALLRGPDLLLLDEPLAGLDPDLKDRILGYLETTLAEWKIPTLLVSHDRGDVNRLAPQVLTLAAGRMVEESPKLPA